jgi:hypothetical protein
MLITPSTSEVKNEWLYISIPPYTFTECTRTSLLYEFSGFRSHTAENSVLLENEAASMHCPLTPPRIPEERNSQL